MNFIEKIIIRIKEIYFSNKPSFSDAIVMTEDGELVENATVVVENHRGKVINSFISRGKENR